MPENCSILFPHFWYSEASGACDGVIPVEKMILVKSAGHPGLLALASRLCPRSVWWGSSGARRPIPNLSKADPRHKHSMWAYNPAYHLRPKKHFSSAASNGTSFMVTLSIVWIENYWWIERKRSQRQQGVEREKTYFRVVKSSSFKKCQDWEGKACADKQLSQTDNEHIVITSSVKVQSEVMVSWNWNH